MVIFLKIFIPACQCKTTKNLKNCHNFKKYHSFCHRIFVSRHKNTVGNAFIPCRHGIIQKALYTVSQAYPPLSTVIHKEKKKQKEKTHQHHYGYYSFFFNFNTLKSKSNTIVISYPSVTFLNELTRCQIYGDLW